MPDQVEAIARIRAHDRHWVWVDVRSVWPTKSLTLPREWLPRGYATEKYVRVKAIPGSLWHDNHGWQATLEIVGKVDRETLDSIEGA